MATKNILVKPAPNLTGIASPEFFETEFDAAIYLKGYRVILERALRCPCHTFDSPLIDCQNCFGTGYFYVNPIDTKALITGINQNNQYKNWSEELLGTIAITVRESDKDNLGFFDKVTIKDQFSTFSENIKVRRIDNELFGFTTYKPVNILAVYTFIASDKPLLKLNEMSYHINDKNGYSVIFEGVEEGDIVSIYYRHEWEGHIIDIPHEIRASWKKDKTTGRLLQTSLPVQAIARRSHLIATDKPNFDGSGIIYNDNV